MRHNRHCLNLEANGCAGVFGKVSFVCVMSRCHSSGKKDVFLTPFVSPHKKMPASGHS